MSAQLDVVLLQAAASLDPEDNRAATQRLVASASAGSPRPADVMVLPEAFARDFGEAGSDISEFAETLDGPFAQCLSAVAAEHGTTVMAGLFEASSDPARPFNTLVMRGAVSAHYRKVHLYDSFGYRESDRLLAGEPQPTVVEVAGWRLGLMTCYDLRFPELARALVDAGAEVLVVPAAWVAGPRKLDHWRTLLRARAIENTAFVVACGQPGPRYTGHSMAVDPWGDVLAEAGAEAEVLSARLLRATLDEARHTNPSLLNRRL